YSGSSYVTMADTTGNEPPSTPWQVMSVSGHDGAARPAGPAGSAGANGIDGAPGAPGPQGPAGSQGPGGPQRAAGADGGIVPRRTGREAARRASGSVGRRRSRGSR